MIDGFGKRLKSERVNINKGSAELAKLCGVGKNTQTFYEKSERKPDLDYLAKAHELGCDIMYIVTGEKTPSSNYVAETSATYKTNGYVEIPRLNIEVSAGHGNEVLTEESDKSLVFKKEWITAHRLQNKDLVMIHAKGDSMEPTIHSGDELLIDKAPMDSFADGIYVIRIDKDLFVKRLCKRLTGVIDIISDNPAYPTDTIDSKNSDLLHVIGKVVWVGRVV